MLLEKITAEQLIEKGVVSAPDKLEGDPQENKYRFDRLVAEAVAPIVNACIDTVNSVEMQEETIKAAEEERKVAEQAREEKETGYVAQAKAAASAAGTAAENAAGSEAEAAASASAAKKSETNAEESARKAAQAALGQIPDGSLEPVKFSPTSRSMMVRENLLDNGHFYVGALVDQRGGYVVPPGTDFWWSLDLSGTPAGQTGGYYKVTKITSGYAICDRGDATFACKPDAIVRGYTGSGYTIDRWKTTVNAVLVEEGGVLIDHSAASSINSFWQVLCVLEELRGKTVTFSVLTKEHGLAHKTYAIPLTGGVSSGESNIGSVGKIDIYANSAASARGEIECRIKAIGGKSFTIVAAKLELGTEQTLAHLENGNWVLNEIPNYAEELAKCQRYQVNFASAMEGGNAAWVALGLANSETTARFLVELPVPMRVLPNVSHKGMSLIGKNFTQHPITEVSSFWFVSQNKCVIQATIDTSSLTSGDPVVLNHYGVSNMLFDANL